jgi:uncharacterized protein YdbL (DUF1318 family)
MRRATQDRRKTAMSVPSAKFNLRMLVAASLAMSFAFVAPAAAVADPVVDAANSNGVTGEQANGYVGVRLEDQADADLRARVDQINILRRQVFTQRASERNVTVNEMAAAVACELFSNRIEIGEFYRDEGGVWRQRTASAPVVMPSFCP